MKTKLKKYFSLTKIYLNPFDKELPYWVFAVSLALF